MTPAEALQTIRALATQGKTRAARAIPWQSRTRPLSFDDLRNALVYAVSCAPRPGDRWAVTGVDLDSEVLTLLVRVEDVLWIEAVEQQGTAP